MAQMEKIKFLSEIEAPALSIDGQEVATKPEVENIVGEASVVKPGTGEYSIQTELSNAIGDYSTAIGLNTIAGMKAYYYTGINPTTKKIYLSEISEITPWGYRNDPLPEYGDIDHTKDTFVTPEWIAGDYLGIINNSHFVYKIKVVSVENNVVTYEGDLGFSQIPYVSGEWDDGLDSYTVFNLSQPLKGAFVLTSCAFAAGRDTKAVGGWSAAVGYDTAAYNHGFASGMGTIAGYASHAEGSNTRAIGWYSHAEGGTVWLKVNEEDTEKTQFITQALGTYSHAEGQATTASGNASHSENYMTEASGWASHAEGNSTKATKESSHAEGQSTTANGVAAHAEGYDTDAVGAYAHAEGKGTEAKLSNNWSYAPHAEGVNTHALNHAAHAEGENSTASGWISHAEGNNTTAVGSGAHSEGKSTLANAEASHAEGYNTQALGTYSHTEGNSTLANAYQSHAEGQNSHAYGTSAHAEGVGTRAGESNITAGNSEGAHAEGRYTHASGKGSHAEGGSTYATGDYSHAAGYGTKANIAYQTVIGKYNAIDTSALFIIGNGTGDAAASRVNAMTVSGGGALKLCSGGSVTIGSTNISETDIKYFKRVYNGNGAPSNTVAELNSAPVGSLYVDVSDT